MFNPTPARIAYSELVAYQYATDLVDELVNIGMYRSRGICCLQKWASASLRPGGSMVVVVCIYFNL